MSWEGKSARQGPGQTKTCCCCCLLLSLLMCWLYQDQHTLYMQVLFFQRYQRGTCYLMRVGIGDGDLLDLLSWSWYSGALRSQPTSYDLSYHAVPKRLLWPQKLKRKCNPLGDPPGTGAVNGNLVQIRCPGKIGIRIEPSVGGSWDGLGLGLLVWILSAISPVGPRQAAAYRVHFQRNPADATTFLFLAVD